MGPADGVGYLLGTGYPKDNGPICISSPSPPYGITMDILTDSTLRQLAEARQPYCVSIYLPTHRAAKKPGKIPCG
jgi:hypothetical protein